MISEYNERFNRLHKCAAVLQKVVMMYNKSLFDNHDPTPLRQAMPEHFKSDNPVLSYRKYYASKPRMRYPKDKIPSWFNEYRGDEPYQVI